MFSFNRDEGQKRETERNKEEAHSQFKSDEFRLAHWKCVRAWTSMARHRWSVHGEPKTKGETLGITPLS